MSWGEVLAGIGGAARGAAGAQLAYSKEDLTREMAQLRADLARVQEDGRQERHGQDLTQRENALTAKTAAADADRDLRVQDVTAKIQHLGRSDDLAAQTHNDNLEQFWGAEMPAKWYGLQTATDDRRYNTDKVDARSRDNAQLAAATSRGNAELAAGTAKDLRSMPKAPPPVKGRQVTSGAAMSLSELDTSLNDLTTLANTIGTTGAGSKVGAMLPNVVTEYTGLGTDSKSRQGTIDRVKQVIGKALEGGVLRKEDEYKYEKILPTIGDPPDVAKTKIQGLQKALVQRRQTMIDSLGDANYDVSNFEARGAPGTNATPPAPSTTPPAKPAKSGAGPAATGKISVTAPDGSVHPFDTQAQADAFKKLAGIH